MSIKKRIWKELAELKKNSIDELNEVKDELNETSDEIKNMKHRKKEK
ncbi:hypothetical protein [Methanosalsum natronophilum]|nr:hypothetical protein [Methanosalsum natronophilum]MCS3924128.1 prefoldin subunit 5 [Methanosalsum natronophilum]